MYCQYLGYNRDSTQSNPAGLLVMDDRWTAAGISETFRWKISTHPAIRLHQNKKTFGAIYLPWNSRQKHLKMDALEYEPFLLGFPAYVQGRFLLLVSAWGFLLPKGRSNGLDPGRHSQLSRAPRTRLARCCSCHWETNCSTNLPGFSIGFWGAPKLREKPGFFGEKWIQTTLDFFVSLREGHEKVEEIEFRWRVRSSWNEKQT